MPLLSLLALAGLGLGLWAEHRQWLSPGRLKSLSWLVVQILYPILLFSVLAGRLHWAELEVLRLMPVLVAAFLALGWIVGLITLAWSRLTSDAEHRAWRFMAIMPNYSFLPLVLAAALLGEKGLALVGLASLGADLFLWTFAFPQISGRFEWRRILSPSVAAIALAVLSLATDAPDRLPLLADALPILLRVGQLTLPLSMIILGVQLRRSLGRLGAERGRVRAHAGLGIWRLLVCPGLLLLILPLTGLPASAQLVLLLMLAMPVAIVSVVLSELYGADSRFISLQILLGHTLAVFTVPIWVFLWLSTQNLSWDQLREPRRDSLQAIPPSSSTGPSKTQS